MDWERAASQMLRALRGKRSQLAFSRRIGYRSNVACDWEAGRRFPTAVDTLRACVRLRIDVAGAFAEFQPACADALAPPGIHIHAWLAELRGATSAATLAERSGHSRYAIARWLRGQTRPRLPDFLALVEAITGRASDLVQLLVPIAAVPELYALHLRRTAAKRVAFDVPWAEAALRVIETAGYRKLAAHEPGYVGARLGISAQDEAAALDGLLRAGVLQRRGPRLLTREPLTVDMAAKPAEINRLKAHWTRAALERLRAPRPQDWLAYNVVSTSAADLDRIREVLRRAFREIRSIAAASEPTESAALLNLQLITWNAPDS